MACAAAGNVERAIELHKQALGILRRQHNRWGQGRVLISLGDACLLAGDRACAHESFRQALEIARDVGDRWGEARAAWQLGLSYEQQGAEQEAVEYLRITVGYEHAIDHPDARQHSAYVEQLQRRLRKGREGLQDVQSNDLSEGHR